MDGSIQGKITVKRNAGPVRCRLAEGRSRGLQPADIALDQSDPKSGTSVCPPADILVSFNQPLSLASQNKSAISGRRQPDQRFGRARRGHQPGPPAGGPGRFASPDQDLPPDADFIGLPAGLASAYGPLPSPGEFRLDFAPTAR